MGWSVGILDLDGDDQAALRSLHRTHHVVLYVERTIMKIGLSLGHSRPFNDLLRLAQHAERIGIDSIWVSEAYGSDAVSVLGYLAAHTRRVGLGSAVLQMAARSPAATAMTAMTLDHLSHGRLLLGLGTSGPQVVRGWHGTRFDAPVARTAEYVDIVRSVVAREAALRYVGNHYQVPFPAGSDDVAPMRSSLHPLRPRVPIYLASNGPRNVALTARTAEGWLPAFWSPDRADLYRELLAPGLADRSPDLPPLRIVATAHVAAGPDLAECRDRLRPVFALYIGAMARATGTSTPGRSRASVTPTPSGPFRTTTSRVGGRRPPPPYRTASSMNSPWSARWTGSRHGSGRGAPAASTW